MSLRSMGVALLSLMITACGSVAPVTAPSSAALAAATSPSATAPTATVEPTTEPTATLLPTEKPTATPRPTATAVPPTATQSSISTDVLFAQNDVATQTQGGIEIKIARVLLGTKAELDGDDQQFSRRDLFKDADVVGQVTFIVTNTSDQLLRVYPTQGDLAVNSEQIGLTFNSVADAQIDGDLLPGASKLGTVYFPIKRVAVPDVNRMQISIDPPQDVDFNTVGNQFYIDIDLSDHRFDPLPDALK